MTQEQSRRLIWHGVFVFFLGLLSGFSTPFLANPRMGLSAHLVAVTAGSFLILMGLIWPKLALSRPGQGWTFTLLLYGAYSNFSVTLLAALWGTKSLTSINGGTGGADWQEILVRVGFIMVIIATLAACLLVLYGLGSTGKRKSL
jgi:hydroxylaminobenzene mutase